MAGSTRDSNAHSGDRRQQAPRRKAGISVPMTAMIDVTFLLLTYFLLTTTFRQNEGQLPGSLPGGGPVPPPATRIRLEVSAVGENCQSVVYSIAGWNRPLRSPQDLAESFQAMRPEDGREPIVEIHAGRAVRWRYIVEAYNQAARAECKATIRI